MAFLLDENEERFQILSGNQIVNVPKRVLSPNDFNRIQALPKAKQQSAMPETYYQIPEKQLPSAGEQIASGAGQAVSLLGMAGMAGAEGASAMPSASLKTPIVPAAAGGAAAASATPAVASVTPGITDPAKLASLVAANQAMTPRPENVDTPDIETAPPVGPQPPSGEAGDFSNVPESASEAALGLDITRALETGREVPEGTLDFSTMTTEETMASAALGDEITFEAGQDDIQIDPETYLPKNIESYGTFRGRVDAINAARDKAVEEQMNEIKAIEQEIKDKSKDMTPFSDKSTAQKVFMTLGFALAAVGQGVAGGDPSRILGMFLNQMDKDIARQKADLQSRRGDIQGKRTMINMLYQKFGDMRSTEFALRNAMMDEADMYLDNMMKKTQNEATRENINIAKERLKQQKLVDAANIQNMKRSRIQEQQKINLMRVAEERRQVEGVVKARREAAEKSGRLQVPGMRLTGERMPSEVEVKDITKARATAVNTIQKMWDMRKYVHGTAPEGDYSSGQGVGTEIYYSREAAMAESMLTDIMLDLKEMANLGVLTGPDVELMLKQLGQMDPTGVWKQQNREILDDVIRRMQRAWGNTARQAGYEDLEIMQLGPKSAKTY